MFSRLGLLRSLAPAASQATTINNNGNLILNYLQYRGAARKGKRIERNRLARLAAAKRRLLEAQNPKPKKKQKVGVKIDKNQFRYMTERQLDMTLPPLPSDDVFFVKDFKRKKFSFEEAIEFHRQIVHPDVLNQPDALVSATIELNLKMKLKKKKYIEKIDSTLCYPHIFQYELKPRKIIALCKSEIDQNAAKEAGAIQAGSLDIANLLKTKQLTTRDFDHIVCHNDFILDFANIKGMKASTFFPSKQRGNFGDNIVELVKMFKNGIDYSLKKNEGEQDYGTIECYFGKLSMTNEQLHDNIVALFKSIDRFKPLNLADNKQFFQRVAITTPASQELFYIKFWELTEDYEDPDQSVAEEAANN